MLGADPFKSQVWQPSNLAMALLWLWDSWWRCKCDSFGSLKLMPQMMQRPEEGEIWWNHVPRWGFPFSMSNPLKLVAASSATLTQPLPLAGTFRASKVRSIWLIEPKCSWAMRHQEASRARQQQLLPSSLGALNATSLSELYLLLLIREGGSEITLH